MTTATKEANTARPGGDGFADAEAALSAGTLTRRLRRAIVHLYEQEAHGIEIGPVETLLLRLIPRAERADADTLCSLAALDMVTFSKWIKRLQRGAMVCLAPPAADRRRRLYRLTEFGERQRADALRAVERTEAAFLRPLAPRDKRLFMRLLTKLVLGNGLNSAVQQDRRIGDVLEGYIDPGTLLRRARLISLHFFAGECGGLGLTPIEAEALAIVAHERELARADLTRKLAIDRASAIGIVRGLAAKGLIQAGAASPRTLRLSKRGAAIGAELVRRLALAEARFLEVLARDERVRFLRLMRRLCRALKAPADRASART